MTCKDDYKPLTKKSPEKSSNHLVSRKKRSIYKKNRVSQLINNIPHNCYWCCKPQPVSQPESQWWSPTTTTTVTTTTTTTVTTTTTTTTTTKTTTRYWWYPETTTKKPFWWFPTSTTTRKPPTWQNGYNPEVIEAKFKRNEIRNSGIWSPANEILFKIKRFHGNLDPIKDDFVVIEDSYEPEIIEAKVK